VVDDFDVELEEAAQQARGGASAPKPAPSTGARPASAPGSGTPAKPASPPAEAPGEPEAAAKPAADQAEGERTGPARAMSARKPGLIGRWVEAISQSLSGLRLPRIDLATVAYGLVGLIVFVLLAQNWAPVRVNVFGVYIDIPKAVAFILSVGIGMLTLWLMQRSLGERQGARRR